MNIFYSALTAFSWATTGIFIKKLNNLDPIFIIWIRLLISLTILSLINFRSLSLKQIFSWKKVDTFSFILSGLMTFYYIAATVAFLLAPVSVVALIIALSPIFTIFFRMSVKEVVGIAEITGCIVAVIGMLLFLSNPDLLMIIFGGKNLIYGIISGIIAAFLKALYSFLLWRYRQNNILKLPNSFSLSQKTFLIGSIVLAPFIDIHDLGNISLQEATLFIGLALLSTILPTVTNSYVSRRLNPTIHTVMGISTPIFASFFAFIILGESLNHLQIIAILIVLSGIIITSFVNDRSILP